ncbi:hypothetical protein JTE90_020570 [Oedothorax gibbosus]|uniref:Uncharacterized protein n=1 Tax=Oedothorax gibbosus TaxID=931172 RepID=A0AAV6VXV8_9ARAC|nr:hypothetical protein JTE90_020570 [Oedothorax gibbosus]
MSIPLPTVYHDFYQIGFMNKKNPNFLDYQFFKELGLNQGSFVFKIILASDIGLRQRTNWWLILARWQTDQGGTGSEVNYWQLGGGRTFGYLGLINMG